MSTIVTEHLTKRYGRRIGIEQLNLTVEQGTIFGFLGPNGSGKTTVIRLLLGLLKATSGAARVFGLDCWRSARRIKVDVGYLPGDVRLYRWLTCDRGLRILSRVRERDLSAPGEELASEFDLERQLPVGRMSRGMRQKLGLLLAMVHRPRLLVLDEPSTGLDPLIQERLFARLREMANAGATVFFSTHTLSEVEMLCDRVAILREGRLVAHESVDDLRRRAPRTVRLRWSALEASRASQPPSFLELLERTDATWDARLTGPTLPLVRWCAEQPLDDVAIGPPDLAGLFRAYYSDAARRS